MMVLGMTVRMNMLRMSRQRKYWAIETTNVTGEDEDETVEHDDNANYDDGGDGDDNENDDDDDDDTEQVRPRMVRESCILSVINCQEIQEGR